MGYVIDAWLEQGEPRLRILDADTGIVRMRWAYRREPQRICSGHPPLNCACGAHANLHTLFKSLFLLACADRLSLAESLNLDSAVEQGSEYVNFCVWPGAGRSNSLPYCDEPQQRHTQKGACSGPCSGSPNG